MKRSLESISLVVGVLSAVLGFVAKAYDLLLPLYYAPEILLGLSAAAGVALGVTLVVSARAGRPGPAAGIGGSPRAKVSLGIALAVLAPVVAVALWWSALRLPPNKRAEVEFYVQSARRAQEFGMPAQALDQYRKALQIDSRRVDIRREVERLQAGGK
jgi:hypothetical protein